MATIWNEDRGRTVNHVEQACVEIVRGGVVFVARTCMPVSPDGEH